MNEVAIALTTGLFGMFVGALGMLVLVSWKSQPKRIPSSAYFHPRPEVEPVMASWRADAVDAARRSFHR